MKNALFIENFTDCLFWRQWLIKDKQLCDIGKQTTEVFAFDYNKSPLGEAKQAHDLNKRNEIPNLLSYQYKLR